MKIINAQTKIPLKRGTQAALRRLIRKVLEREGKSIRGLSVILVDNAYIQSLNKRFLKRDRPTDVLAFPLETPEIYVSVEYVSADDPSVILQELKKSVLHGVLHLLGYEHGARGKPSIEAREKEYELDLIDKP